MRCIGHWIQIFVKPSRRRMLYHCMNEYDGNDCNSQMPNLSALQLESCNSAYEVAYLRRLRFVTVYVTHLYRLPSDDPTLGHLDLPTLGRGRQIYRDGRPAGLPRRGQISSGNICSKREKWTAEKDTAFRKSENRLTVTFVNYNTSKKMISRTMPIVFHTANWYRNDRVFIIMLSPAHVAGKCLRDVTKLCLVRCATQTRALVQWNAHPCVTMLSY